MDTAAHEELWNPYEPDAAMKKGFQNHSPYYAHSPSRCFVKERGCKPLLLIAPRSPLPTSCEKGVTEARSGEANDPC